MASRDVHFEQRAVFEFFVADNVKPVDSHRRLLLTYGNETLDISFVRRWVLRIMVAMSEKPFYPIKVNVDGQ